MKTRVFRKKTHTSQYLAFSSHHPLHQKMGVIRTLLDRYNAIVTGEEDNKEEKGTIKDALRLCDYPDWTMKSVTEQMENKSKKYEEKQIEVLEKGKRMFVLLWVQGLSE